jgi:hypothetical protein
MPLDRKWLFTKEHEIVQNNRNNKKKQLSPKKTKKKKKSPKSTASSTTAAGGTGGSDAAQGSGSGDLETQSQSQAHDDSSAMTNQSSNAIVTSIFSRETKRAGFLRSQLSNDSNRRFPAGAPVGHISRQLNANHAMNYNVDYNTTNQLFQLSVDQSKMLTFNQKKTQQMRNGTLPPLEKTVRQQEENWDRRMYPPCGLFDDMTPREGGYYPDNVVSKRKQVKYKPVVNKGFSIRTDVQKSVDGTSIEDGEDNHSATSEITANDETYESLVKDLFKRGNSLCLNDLTQISRIQNPHDYINTVFRYIHILILGFDQKRQATKRDVVNRSGGEPDAKQTLLKECSPLLLYMQHVSLIICIARNSIQTKMSLFRFLQINPLNIPASNCKLASRFFRAKILLMQPRDLGRISTPFSKVVR